MSKVKLYNIIITVGFLIFISVLIFFYNAFSGTTWGGWTPPDVSLKLSDNEKIWVENIENKYKVYFDYIGLDNGYTEDSIIYISLNCNNKSMFKNNQITDTVEFTKELCEQFYGISEYQWDQNYIMFSYYNLKNKNKYYPTKISFLFYKKSNSIVKIEWFENNEFPVVIWNHIENEIEKDTNYNWENFIDWMDKTMNDENWNNKDKINKYKIWNFVTYKLPLMIWIYEK